MPVTMTAASSTVETAQLEMTGRSEPADHCEPVQRAELCHSLNEPISSPVNDPTESPEQEDPRAVPVFCRQCPGCEAIRPEFSFLGSETR